jgi:hypothetical protein
MQKPPLDPDVADTAPSEPALTLYDEEHVITYLRLLDADAQGAWRMFTIATCTLRRKTHWGFIEMMVPALSSLFCRFCPYARQG